MGKKKVTRVLSLMMAILLFVSSTVLAVGASSNSVTDKKIGDYIGMSGLRTYDEYIAQEFGYAQSVPSDLVVPFDATTNWVFKSSAGEIVEIIDGVWTLTTSAGEKLTMDDVKAEGSNRNINDYVYITTEDGLEGLYTPSLGEVTWELDLAAMGLTDKAIYNISMLYYPIENKPASIEREFYINGEVPFVEARSLTLPKRWSSYSSDGKSALVAVVTPDKDLQKEHGGYEQALTVIHRDASLAGLTVEKHGEGEDQKLTIYQPMVITAKITAFIEK